MCLSVSHCSNEFGCPADLTQDVLRHACQVQRENCQHLPDVNDLVHSLFTFTRRVHQESPGRSVAMVYESS